MDEESGHLMRTTTSSTTTSPWAGQGEGGFSPWFRRSIQFACALATVFLLVGLGAIWHQVTGVNLTRERPSWLPALVALGIGSYSLRFLRWHVLIRQVAPRLRLVPSLRIYAAGFALGVTPGRIGEFCKFALLREETGVPVTRSALVFPIERVTEAASFTALAVVGATLGHFTLGPSGTAVFAAVAALPVLALGGAAIRLAIRRKRQAGPASYAWLRLLLDGFRTVSGPRPLALAMLCACAARCCDATLFWVATGAVGLSVPLAGAALAFGLAGLTGGLLLLPAGVGAVEGSLVATVVALGGDASAALVAALIARCFTLWVWMPAGLWIAARSSFAPATANAKEMAA
jgi:uncharacterized membrane protein YbhN (UPF0104 family)